LAPEPARRLAADLRRDGRRSRLRVRDHRQHHRPGASARRRGQRGAEAQAIGRSRGGLTTKIHLVVDGLGDPARFSLTPGQAHDITQAHLLVDDLPGAYAIADASYDADHLRDPIEARGALAVIPGSTSRARRVAIDRPIYKERHLVECCFSKLKGFRRIATRYDKTAASFLSMVTLAATILWLR
jgi:transposase